MKPHFLCKKHENLALSQNFVDARFLYLVGGVNRPQLHFQNQ